MCGIGESSGMCRGAHRAGNQKCLVRERQVEVAMDRVVKKVEEDGSRWRDPERSAVRTCL
jgi:hypothetical protein